MWEKFSNRLEACKSSEKFEKCKVNSYFSTICLVPEIPNCINLEWMRRTVNKLSTNVTKAGCVYKYMQRFWSCQLIVGGRYLKDRDFQTNFLNLIYYHIQKYWILVSDLLVTRKISVSMLRKLIVNVVLILKSVYRTLYQSLH